MTCLTMSEQSELLARLSIVEEPYGKDIAPKHYCQFYAPKTLRAIQAVTRDLGLTFFKSNQALLTVKDWALYDPHEMHLFESLRKTHGESRPLIEAPAHLFTSTEHADLIGLFGLSVAFEWTSYLYFVDSRVTLLNWEGVIFDFWSAGREAREEMSETLKM